MTQKKNYIIGTRGSLLAVTQSTQIKRKLEKLTGDHFELKLIETTGDQIANIPLWQADGKDFFTKELDRALLDKEIDLVIHSYKDLGSVRPQGIHLAAITKRYHSQDILFIKKETSQKIGQLNELIVGTSAPRRGVNLKKNLNQILPVNEECQLTIKVLRGNINNRIKKLQNNEYHAIVIAMAGVERLCEEALLNQDVSKELNEILKDLNFCVLPQSLFPSAAAQGTLAIECLATRNDNDELLNKINLLNDSQTSEEVSRERKAFNEYGGGCHLAVGITVKKINENFVHIHQGESKGIISKSLLERKYPLPTKNEGKVFVGLPKSKTSNIPLQNIVIDHLIEKKSLDLQNRQVSGHLLVAVDYGTEQIDFQSESHILWTSSVTTMKKMVAKKHWCHGALDIEGEAALAGLINSPLIKFMMPNLPLSYTLLSHQEARALSKESKVLAVYERIINENIVADIKKNISEVNTFFWTSFFQYKTYLKYFPEIKNKTHCSGLGKTLRSFMEEGIEVHPFVNMNEFYEWQS